MTTAGNIRSGASSHSPQMMTNMAGTIQYGIVIRADWGITVFSHTIATGAIATYDLSSNSAARTGLALYLQSGVYGVRSSDDHYALAVGVDSQDRIWIAGNGHSDTIRAVRSSAASISSWTDPYSGGGGSYPFFTGLTGLNQHTYHHFARMANGDLLWFTDQEESTVSSRGRDYLMARLASGAGTTWVKVLSTWEFAQSIVGTPFVDADRVYVNSVRPTADGKLHVCGAWRTDDDNAESQIAAFYVWADQSDLTTWYAVDGTAMSMPLTFANYTAAHVPMTQTWFNTAGHLGIDDDGYPHIPLQNDDNATDFFEHYYDATGWHQRAIISEGSALGPGLHGLNGSIYLLTQGSSRIRIRDTVSGALFYAGAASSGMEIQPDPIPLLDGTLSFCVPDGDTPRIYTFGNHARFNAA